VKNTPPTQAKKKTKDELAQEELKKAIEEKLSLFEDSDTINQSKTAPTQTPFEDEMQAKLTKIYQSDADSKAKVVQMVEMFYSELLPAYEKTSASIIRESSENSILVLNREEYKDRKQKADLIVQKYEILSKEYQNQAKLFRTKHQEIKEAEQAKYMQISNNFESHINSIKEQL